eukprot:2678685-Amphidinium_carterae.2
MVMGFCSSSTPQPPANSLSPCNDTSKTAAVETRTVNRCAETVKEAITLTIRVVDTSAKWCSGHSNGYESMSGSLDLFLPAQARVRRLPSPLLPFP